ncbi:hypothetical protein QBC44DRAFT_365917 [Cladorrhinum sp. PSN332]|nr:hypothetical protein QBC44DRAFT_365917 [Cladorrhinum sp. PSN332]
MAVPAADRSRNTTASTSPLAVDKGHGIKWTGVIFPGEPATELWGTVEEIYEQVLALNPNYVAQPIENEAKTIPSLSLPDRHAKNNNTTTTTPDNLLMKRDTLNCGASAMATGYIWDLRNQVSYHWNLGGYCQAPANQCRRTACHATTATYLCGEYGNAANVPCRDVAYYVDVIINTCCNISNGRSGSYYTNTFSVWAGYGDCWHPVNNWPSYYYYPGGNNGLCYVW